MYVQLLLKRVFDVVVSTILLLLLAPLILAIALVIWITMGRPIFFRQARTGFRNVPFRIVKFRTMRRKPEGELEIPGMQQGPRFGTFLRKTSLDELPELYNVLIGDMSLVGPRPLLADYLDYYRPSDLRRHEVRPGITGYSQVNGRQLVKFSKRLDMDVWYVDHWSFWLDIKLLFRTLFQLKSSDGAAGFATIEEIDDLGLCRGLKHHAPSQSKI